jgi:WD40 repeat protein
MAFPLSLHEGCQLNHGFGVAPPSAHRSASPSSRSPSHRDRRGLDTDEVRPRFGSEAVVRSAFWSVAALDSVTGANPHTLAWNGDAIRDFALSQDGLIAATADEDRAVRVWDLGTGRCRHVLTGHRSDVLTVAIWASGALVVTFGPSRY